MSKETTVPKNIPRNIIAEKHCLFCGKTIREQKQGCNEITCYRQYLPKITLKPNENGN